MRLLISLVLTLLLVGTGYVIWDHYFRPEITIEDTSAPAPAPAHPKPPAQPTPVNPPPPARVEPDKPAPPEPPVPAENHPKPSPKEPWTDVERRVLELTNAARREAHLSPLLAEDGLRECAVTQSLDMIVRHFFDHVNPSGENPSDRVARIYRQMIGATGENIWEATGPSYTHNADLGAVIVDSWMHSPHHRENILRPQFTHLGVGVVIRGEEVRATQSFETVRAYLNTPLPETVAAGAPLDLGTHGQPPAPEMYDLSPGSGQPQPIAGATASAKPGKYRLRLFFRTSGNGFTIVPGPSLTVTKP